MKSCRLPSGLVRQICLALGLIALASLPACDRGNSNNPGGTLASSTSTDLNGKPLDPLSAQIQPAVVLIFLDSECPISNRYAPEIRRLHEMFHRRGVRFWLVYPNRDQSPEAIHKHIQEYQFGCDAVRDPLHALVRRAHAKVTPEAAVFVSATNLVYHGAIDNREVAFGQQRPEATRHYLEDVLQSIVNQTPLPLTSAEAVGCYIPEP